MAREYIDELGDGTINPETSGVDSQATDNGTHVKTLAPIYYTPATIANDGKATRETPVTIKSALDGKQNTLATQTAYSAKGTATKVPQITTNSLGQVTGITEVTISGVTPASHAHGNIANGGTLTDTAAAAAGNDYVVIRDADNAKIQTSTIKGTDVADAVSKTHSHSTLTLSTTAQSYDGSHTLALPSTDPYTSARTPVSHASTATTYGIGTTSTYGHVKLATGDMNGATNTDGVAVSKNHTHSQYAPKASPSLTGTPTAPTAADGTNTTQIATTAFVQSAVTQGLSVSDAMVYKGTITLGATSPGGLTVAADKGHTYKVVANGNTKEGYVDGVKVEAGDMVICNADSTAAATSSNYSTIAAKWDFVQGNTDGVVVGPASATSGNVVVFDGATGKLVKDGGTLGTAAFKSVTDTYSSTGTDPVSGKAVAAAINTLNVTEVGGDGKYIKKIKEDNGKITATVETMDTTPTASSTNAVTSGGVKTELDNRIDRYDAIYTRNNIAGGGWVKLADTKPYSTITHIDKPAIWDVMITKCTGETSSEQLCLNVRYDNTGLPNVYFKRFYTVNRTSTHKFAVVVSGVGGGNVSEGKVELWAFLEKHWGSIAIREVAGSTNTTLYNMNKVQYNYYSYNLNGGTDKPVEDLENNIQVVDSTNIQMVTDQDAAKKSDGVYYVVGTTDYPAWQASHAYVVNDYAISGGEAYYCKTAHTSGTSFDSSKWTAVATPVIKGTVSNISALFTGMKIALKWPITGGSSSTYLNINNLGNVYIRRNDSNITTHVPANTVTFLAYDGTYWRWSDYDSNSTYSGMVTAYLNNAGDAAKSATSTNFKLTDGITIILTNNAANTKAAALTLNVNSTGAKALYINGNISSSTNYTIPIGTYFCHYKVVNGTGQWHLWTDGTANFTKLHLDTPLSDTEIASAVTWNAKQDAITYMTLEQENALISELGDL